MLGVDLHSIDIGIIIIYGVSMVLLGLYLSGKSHGAEDYFLAGRTMRWPTIGFSLFASNISSTTLVGLAGAAYATGISVYNYEWMAAFVLAFFALFILPFVLRSQVFTMPEYLEKRFSRTSRTYFAILTLFLNIIVDTAGSLFAGSLIVKMIFPQLALWEIITVLALVAGAYTILGGLSAVMITDVIQAVLLLVGSVIITYIAFDKVGGWHRVIEAVPPDMMSLVRPMDDPFMPWLGLITGVPLLGFYFWCTNQFMAQRLLSAKDANHARWGALLAGFLKLPVLLIMVIPGTIALVLYPSLEKADFVYPTLMFDLLPVGLLGLVLAGFMAALMSQIDSTLNSASTLVTMDFIRTLKPNLSSNALMQIGRFVTFLFMLLACIWAPQIDKAQSIFSYLQQVLSYTIGPIVALYLVGAFWARANAFGANMSLLLGTATGAFLFYINVLNPALNDGAEPLMHFLYAAPIVFVVSSLVLIFGSMLAPAPERAKVEAFIWTPAFFREETKELSSVSWYMNYRYQFIILIAVTFAILAAFW